MLRLVQFDDPLSGRRLGVVRDDVVFDLTAAEPEVRRTIDAAVLAITLGMPLETLCETLADSPRATRLDYRDMHARRDRAAGPVLCPPVDHPDPYRTMVTGTGLTHTGSMQSRDQMHSASGIGATGMGPTGTGAPGAGEARSEKKPPVTEHVSDSRKMFELGLAGGKPKRGEIGVAPEWFYKGLGHVLRAHNEPLDLPEFALDGGEEPEIVACYLIDPDGRPRRLGFALGNEWSDHATEKINYLYLAPSKLRTCAVGPELIVGHDFQYIELCCTVRRGGETIYDSDRLLSGERHMCHSLENLEYHHFKFPQHRQPGDVHLHFLGTSKLSHGRRDWKFQHGDQIRVEAASFSAPLENTVRATGRLKGNGPR